MTTLLTAQTSAEVQGRLLFRIIMLGKVAWALLTLLFASVRPCFIPNQVASLKRLCAILPPLQTGQVILVYLGGVREP